MARTAYLRCILFPCCPLAGGKDVPPPLGTHLSTTSCKKRGGITHIRTVANCCPLPSAWFTVEAPGLAGMHRESEGILEATVRSNRVQMSAEHYAQTLIIFSLPFPPFTPQGVIWMEGTAGNHSALTLS